MIASLLIQTVGASFYKIQTLTTGKELDPLPNGGKQYRLWKHPYWTTALTTVGELLVFLVYFAKEWYYGRQNLRKT